MKIIEFEINNYRAIDNIKFTLNYSMNPIIGINESGKTSVLKAILAFDKTRDKLNNGEHLEYQNKYSTNDTKESKVIAKLQLNKDEIKELIKSLKLKTNSTDYEYLSRKNEDEIFILERSLVDKIYSYSNENISLDVQDKVKKYLIINLPFILYFDDFTDRVPSKIKFPDTYINDGKIPARKHQEWKEIVEEIFKRADTDGIENNPLKDYMNIEDRDRKGDILADVQDTLNTEIIDEWKRIKKTGKSFADDSEHLEIVMSNDDDNVFTFKVKDKAYKGKKRTFAINERSKGFQWFFNYMVKLKFNPNYKKSLENSIFLLDEPGSYLHSSAQIELLKELHRVSERNTIIYCTHSQYLLNPNVIKLGSIKIAEKSKSEISLVNYGGYKSTKDMGALSPVYQALQLNYATDHLGNIIITEGITDYYLFEMIKNHSSDIDNNIKFLPGYGAKQLSSMISLAISFSTDFLVFLDNDKEGQSAKKLYIKEFGEQIENNIFIYGKNETKFELENYLHEKDKKILFTLTNTDNIKRALGFLYYDYKDKQKDFIDNLDMNKLKEVFEKIKIFK